MALNIIIFIEWCLFAVAELADTVQFFYVLFIGVRDVIPLADKWCIINPVKKLFDEVGKTAFIKRAFKGFFDKFLCLLFIDTPWIHLTNIMRV